MRAKFIYESIDDVLKPKSKEDIIKDLSKFSKEEIINGNFILKTVENNSKDLVKKLLFKGCFPNKLYNGKNLLKVASQYNYKDIVEMLIYFGADVNEKDVDGMSPLQAACAHFSDKNIIEILLKHGADPNYKNKHGYTALGYAKVVFSTPIREEVIELLKKYGAIE